jgi:Hemerythrin HHE cation binding domain
MKQPKAKLREFGATSLQQNSEAVASEFRACLATKEQFCDQLEAIADLLPDNVDVRDCLLAAQKILPMVIRAHVFEEHVVYPMLLEIVPDTADITAWLERLKYEHMGDEDFAGDLCLALRDFATNRSGAKAVSLSWMLRGFFEGLRRHVAFERSNLLPILESSRH